MYYELNSSEYLLVYSLTWNPHEFNCFVIWVYRKIKSLGNSSEFFLLSSKIKVLYYYFTHSITQLISYKQYKCFKLTNSFDEWYLSNEISKMVQSCFINVVISTDRFPSCWVLEHWFENPVFVKRHFSIYKLESEVNFHPILHNTTNGLARLMFLPQFSCFRQIVNQCLFY